MVIKSRINSATGWHLITVYDEKKYWKPRFQIRMRPGKKIQMWSLDGKYPLPVPYTMHGTMEFHGFRRDLMLARIEEEYGWESVKTIRGMMEVIDGTRS